MNRPKRSDSLVDGCATALGTSRLERRFAPELTDHFYRPLAGGRRVSSLGMGTYLGDCDDAEDARYAVTGAEALRRGINLLDTAINYRCQRSERSIGSALRIAIGRGTGASDAGVVCPNAA